MRKRGAERAMSMGTSRACWKGTDWMGTGETPPAEGSHSSVQVLTHNRVVSRGDSDLLDNCCMSGTVIGAIARLLI